MMDPGGGRTLLDPTDLRITAGMKYGLVGKNGYGVYFFFENFLQSEQKFLLISFSVWELN